ncbi:hypothetical protein GCM10011490_25360 [Pseudoclavibacter endophyticus]|uniref:Two-component sensor histidine kinase n=1 Tax=Pseudoclavibacter endophyticus TaxID=1778590 RepID=A0A6H9WMU0_9MICO|nr:hypothetical protein [Pseudoclavibacter endophyticus]KAB1647866.1 hypothetical protein F8O04_12665 [Pseudoclavibacter endophyticus]GGA73428.1 hypothetical protein GCM10011490_25360 [Pseudoclavibacter endophyticus]
MLETGRVVGVVAACLAVLVMAASLALRSVASTAAVDTVERVAAEIMLFSQTAVDPATGGAFQSADRFIEVYLSQRVAGRGELLAGTSNGGERLALVRGDGAHDLSAISDEARLQVLAPGSAGTTSSAGVGAITWRNVKVHAGDTRGFVAVVVFHAAESAAAAWSAFGLAALAVLALVAVGLTTWRVSRRPRRDRRARPSGGDATALA